VRPCVATRRFGSDRLDYHTRPLIDAVQHRFEGWSQKNLRSPGARATAPAVIVDDQYAERIGAAGMPTITADEPALRGDALPPPVARTTPTVGRPNRDVSAAALPTASGIPRPQRSEDRTLPQPPSPRRSLTCRRQPLFGQGCAKSQMPRGNRRAAFRNPTFCGHAGAIPSVAPRLGTENLRQSGQRQERYHRCPVDRQRRQCPQRDLVRGQSPGELRRARRAPRRSPPAGARFGARVM
jgi:hypothetical protein